MQNTSQALITQFTAVVVVGLGVSGYSVVRYLSARGVQPLVVDSREQPSFAQSLSKNYPAIATHYGDFANVDIPPHSLVVVSPGVPLTEPLLIKAKAEQCRLVGDIELFLAENDQPVIAITGSNGKSTVTELVGQMCKAGGLRPLVAGNIGLPALDAITDEVDYDIAVLELSSFQLETTHHVSAQAAAILNISPDHMDRYPSLGDYVLAKARILKGAERVVLPRYDKQLAQISKFGNVGKITTFGLDAPNNDDDFGVKRSTNYRWLMKGQSKVMRLRDIPLNGMHNVANVLAALALVDFLKLSAKDLALVIKQFTGLAHRMQTVAEFNTVRWVNDSKATNIGATQSALTSLESPVVWIAGGQAKGADFSPLRASITNKIIVLILLGEDADKIEQAMTGVLPIVRADDMADAVTIAAAHAIENSVVLLSPACASLDMYTDFEQRGDDFAKHVQSHLQQEAS